MIASFRYQSVDKLLLRLHTITQTQLETLHPSPQAMLSSHAGKVKGVIVTVKGKNKYDFLSRYFAPWVGIPEDPVMDSAHAVLGFKCWTRERCRQDSAHLAVAM